MHISYRIFALALIFLWTATPGAAQITIQQSDLEDKINSDRGIQVLVAETPSDLTSLAGQTGTSQTWDFRPYTFLADTENFTFAIPFDATSTEVPRASDFASLGATVVGATQFDGAASLSDSTAWLYQGLSNGELRFYGSLFPTSQDVNMDGTTPDTLTTEYDPGRLDFAFPIELGDTWSSSSQVSGAGLPGTETVDAEVVGSGQIQTPFGTFDVLQIEEARTTDNGFFQNTFRSVKWIDKNGRIDVTVSVDDQGDVTDGSMTLISSVQDTYQLAASSTPSSPLSGSSGVEVTVTQASTTSGRLGVARYDGAPISSSFSSASATSEDGSTIVPDVIWEGFYFSIAAFNLSDFTVDLCVETDNVGGTSVTGINDVDQLVVVTREDASQPWTALNTTVDGTKLCVSDVTSFSQFAIGGEQATNPLPVELTAFGAAADGRDVLLTWSTASETDNAGFAIERSTDDGPWTRVGFVEGAGTTTEAQGYRFRIADAGFGRHDVRLRQVDLDGAATLSGVRTVTILPDVAAEVDAYPNPIRVGSDARIEVTPRKAQSVTVDVVDLLGRRVDVLFDGPLRAGETKRLTFRTSGRASGLYFVRVQGETFRSVRKVSVVR